MQEDFLHYVWKYKAFNTSVLKTSNGEDILITNIGHHNLNSGPDFFNTQLSINGQSWAGNLEIHVKSSDWYVHNHEVDKAYDNVILHVVWEHDTEVFRKDNSEIPTLELKPYVESGLLENYKQLIHSKSWINCESYFPEVDDFLLNNWLERVYIDRLGQKYKAIQAMLENSHNDWEAVLFKMLLKNFGLKVNGESFLSLANSIDFKVFRKARHNIMDMEALLFGQANLLFDDIQHGYFLDIKKRYTYLYKKFNLNNQGVLPIQFFRLRPPNFPTIRLSQFANLYTLEQNLFSKVLELKTRDQFYNLFQIGVTDFWMTHYTFSKSSKITSKRLTKSFIDLLIINTIIPLKFAYAKAQGKVIDDDLFHLIRELKIERNSVVDKFLDLKTIAKTALNSQALLQLKQEYCDKNKCLSCSIGNNFLVSL